MIRLNEKGWGLTVFIVFLGVFFIAIVLISIGAYKLGIAPNSNISNLPSSNNQSEVHYTESEISAARNYEAIVQQAAARYFSDKYSNQWTEDRNIVTASLLVENRYLETYSVAGSRCYGYVVVQPGEGQLTYKPYVNCGNVYTTVGYDFSIVH